MRNSKTPFDIIPFVSNCTLDILCGKFNISKTKRLKINSFIFVQLETVMGINVNAQGSIDSKYVDAVLKYIYLL